MSPPLPVPPGIQVIPSFSGTWRFETSTLIKKTKNNGIVFVLTLSWIFFNPVNRSVKRSNILLVSLVGQSLFYFVKTSDFTEEILYTPNIWNTQTFHGNVESSEDWVQVAETIGPNITKVAMPN